MNTKTKLQKVFALALSFALVFGALPVQALASVTNDKYEVEQTERFFTTSSGLPQMEMQVASPAALAIAPFAYPNPVTDFATLQAAISGAPTNGEIRTITIGNNITMTGDISVWPGTNVILVSGDVDGVTLTIGEIILRHFIAHGTLTMGDNITLAGRTPDIATLAP